MDKRSKIFFLFIIVTLAMMTCSAVPFQNKLQTLPNKTYLPMVAWQFPTMPFGVDGKSSFSLMKEAGVNLLRLNAQLHWSAVEPTEGNIDWSKAAFIDRLLIDAANNGLAPILLIQSAPTWARKDQYKGSLCGPIREDKIVSFGNFLHEVVKRYSAPPYNVRYYQIWNEPDAFVNNDYISYGCWAEDTDETYGGRYFGRMMAQVYPRVKAANSNAQVLLGSMMLICDPRDPNPENYCADVTHRKMANFFQGIMEEGRNAFDMVLFNSGPSFLKDSNDQAINYVWLEMNNWRWDKDRGGLVKGKIDYLRGVMNSYGVNKPIIHSEAYFLDKPLEYQVVGNENAAFNLFEMEKADYLVWVYAHGWSEGLQSVVWYSVEGWKGSELILDGEPTEAYQALKTMTAMTKNFQYDSRVDYPAGFSLFLFTSKSEDLWLLIPTGKTYGVSYAINKPAKFLQAVEYDGTIKNVPLDSIDFNRPIYVFVGH